MKRIAIYPGSFDPVTNGHIDIIERQRHLFDEIIVAVSDNSSKHPYFSLSERLGFLRRAVRRYLHVRVEHFSGLLQVFNGAVFKPAPEFVEPRWIEGQFISQLKTISFRHGLPFRHCSRSCLRFSRFSNTNESRLNGDGSC